MLKSGLKMPNPWCYKNANKVFEKKKTKKHEEDYHTMKEDFLACLEKCEQRKRKIIT